MKIYCRADGKFNREGTRAECFELADVFAQRLGVGEKRPEVFYFFFFHPQHSAAERSAHPLVQTCRVIVAVQIRNFEIEMREKLSFWDAMIVSAAFQAGVTKIISEDLNAGQTIAGIIIENPFA